MSSFHGRGSWGARELVKRTGPLPLLLFGEHAARSSSEVLWLTPDSRCFPAHNCSSGLNFLPIFSRNGGGVLLHKLLKECSRIQHLLPILPMPPIVESVTCRGLRGLDRSNPTLSATLFLC
jgi:hypothetical protein